MSVKINKIVLEIGEKKIELTEREAKQLKLALVDLFGNTERVIHHTPTYPWYPYWGLTYANTRLPDTTVGTTIYLNNKTTGGTIEHR